MTFLEHKLTDHIEVELFTETTSDRVKKLPNGDKRTDFSISGETPYGVDKLKEAMKHDPWFGGDYHIKDMLDSKRKASIINKYVKANDHLIIMGDMEDHDDPDIDVVKDFVRRIVCKNKYLVIGNNDSFPLEEYKEMGICCVTDIFQYKNYTLSHFPLEVKDGDCCIHAHLHGDANEDQKGADAHWYCDGAKCYDIWSDNFIPIRLSTIEKEFYHTAMESVIVPAIIKPWKDYYRVTYEGEGIYEAVRKRVGMETWKMLLKNTNINWLPKPPEYYSGYMSFFTEHGYEIFQKTSLPILSSYLTKSKIKVEKTDKPGYIMYQDEYQVVTTNDTGIRLLNIVKFNEKLNGMKYQIRNKEYYMKDIDSEDFDKYYRVLSPHDFIKYGGGVCWDYVIYQEYYFDKFFPGTEIHTFYHQTIHEENNDCPSHTFMIFTIDKRWFWFESSWKNHMGVWEFSSLNDAISYISDELIKHAKMEPGISKYKDEFLVEYTALDPYSYGQTCGDFMNHKFSIPQYKYHKIHGVKPIKRYLNKDQYRRINGNKPIMESGNYEKKDINEEVMEESVIFSKKNIELNMNLWKMNHANVLYITGLSGGGKTTLSKTYASKDVEVIEFDALTTSLIRGINTLRHPELIHPLIIEYLNTIKYTTTIKWSDGGVLESHCRAFVEFLEKRAKEEDKRYVLEGTQIYSYIPASYFRNKPLIILGVSLLRSLQRRTSRSIGKEDKLMEKLAAFLHELGLIPLLYKNEKKKKDFENDANEIFSESVLFKRDNLYFNTKTLRPGTDNNIVFITGFPGAGKTTTLQQIQNRFPYVEGISLDFLTVPLVKTKRANDWKEWLNKKPEISVFIKGYLDKNYDRVKLLNNDFNDPRLIPVYLDFIDYVKIELMKPEYKNYIAVIEGTQLFSIFVENPNYFDDKAFILIGTSLLTAFCRKIKRDVITDKNYTWENIKRQLGMIPVYKGYNKILEKIYKKYDNENDGDSFLNYMNQ